MPKPRRALRLPLGVTIALAVMVVALAVVGYLLWSQTPSEPKPAAPAVVAKPAATAKPAGPAVAKKTDVAPKPEAAAEPKWYGAAQEVKFPGQEVSVKVQSVRLGNLPPEMALPAGSAEARKGFLIVTVNVHNSSGAKKLDFQAWGKLTSASGQVELRDNVANHYQQFPVRAQALPSVYPGETYADVLVFQPPVSASKYLRLTLPASAFGGHDSLRFEIPSSMITQESEPAKPAEPAAAVPGKEAPAAAKPDEAARKPDFGK